MMDRDDTELKKKILVVDDEEEICMFLGVFFQRHGFEVVTSNDGVDGLNKIRQEKPDIVILDLMLPRLSGEEVCRELRKDEFFEAIPIIMLTGKVTDVDRVMGRVIGADCYMTKPFDINKLLEEVKKLIQGKE